MRILDACCGSRMFWYDKNDSRTTFMDKRCYHEQLATGHVVDVSPDIQADFTAMPFDDESFDLVVFDPPFNPCRGALVAPQKVRGSQR